jgi:Uma2 family endonuclease
VSTVQANSSVQSERNPAWEIAMLFPDQGQWTENDYLDLNARRTVEFKDGFIEVLPMPTFAHELILHFLYHLLDDFVRGRNLGMVFYSGLRFRPRAELIRFPDLMYVTKEDIERSNKLYAEHAHILMEVVSPDAKSHLRDHVEKREDYAQGLVPEYWIIDPQKQKITVLVLDGAEYRVHGDFAPGQQASSVLLSGFVADVTAVFNAANSLG